MRVLCVGNRYPPWSLGGYEVTWADAVSALRAAGHVTRVLSTRPDPTDLPADGPPDPDVHRDLRWYWRAHEFPNMSLTDCARLERANASTLDRHRRDFVPDVVAWWAMGGMSLSLVEQVRRAGVPAIGVVGDDWMAYGPKVDGWTRRWRGVLGPFAGLAERVTGVPAHPRLELGALWIFNSEYTRAEARAAGWELPRTRVAHPGVDLERFSPTRRRDWAWRLLYCGRLDPRKGVETAIDAVAQLPESATLRIQGHGDDAYVQRLESSAAGHGLGDRVSFHHSSHESVAEAYASADAVLFPVRWREPWGLVPLEAMASGRPVIASRAGGGAAEYLEEGRNCLQFDPGDANALAAQLRTLAKDSQLRARLVDGGRATAMRFSAAAYNHALIDALHDVTGREDQHAA